VLIAALFGLEYGFLAAAQAVWPHLVPRILFLALMTVCACGIVGIALWIMVVVELRYRRAREELTERLKK